MKYFKCLTQNSVVIMGRNTWISIGSKPLPKRLNLVISSTLPPSDSVFPSLDAALASLPAGEEREVWIIGGSALYKEALSHPSTTHIHLSRVTPAVDVEYDVFFPRIPETFVECGVELLEYARERGVDVENGFPRVMEANGNEIEFTLMKRI